MRATGEEGSMQEDRREENFDYMEKLSEAYASAFAKRIAETAPPIPEEKRDLLVKMQREIAQISEAILPACKGEERKELTLMIRESAEEILTLFGAEREAAKRPYASLPPALLLPRGVLLANRSLNAIIRHSKTDQRLLPLLLSELSAFYALAAIS